MPAIYRSESNIPQDDEKRVLVGQIELPKIRSTQPGKTIPFSRQISNTCRA